MIEEDIVLDQKGFVAVRDIMLLIVNVETFRNNSIKKESYDKSLFDFKYYIDMFRTAYDTKMCVKVYMADDSDYCLSFYLVNAEGNKWTTHNLSYAHKFILMFQPMLKAMILDVATHKIESDGICQFCGEKVRYWDTEASLSFNATVDDNFISHQCSDTNVDTSSTIEGVYFVVTPNNEKVKIGRSIDIYSRFSTLKSQYLNMTGEMLSLYTLLPTSNSIEIEKNLHRKFDEYREHGEWFKVSPEIQTYMNEVKDKVTLQS